MKVTVNYPQYLKGEIIEIPLLGAFENGSTTDVNESRVAKFVKVNSAYEGSKELVFGTPAETPSPDVKPANKKKGDKE